MPAKRSLLLILFSLVPCLGAERAVAVSGDLVQSDVQIDSTLLSLDEYRDLYRTWLFDYLE